MRKLLTDLSVSGATAQTNYYVTDAAPGLVWDLGCSLSGTTGARTTKRSPDG